MLSDHNVDHLLRLAAVTSVAAKINCSVHSLNEWVKKADVDSGKRVGLPSDVAEKIEALSRRTMSFVRPAQDGIVNVSSLEMMLYLNPDVWTAKCPHYRSQLLVTKRFQ
ncbi:hypothetical protein JYP49_12700 [Nitratireductor aquimarinus]|nr:hypothetical protein [Nitratireductor pacificus]MBN7781452.1 hypothetical protein [Nitratireductor pacificus]MBN7790258.1 hypothetical protein [Nitratireductor aquimarinus]MBY6099668.1 hypothetical protein [Nitratireductor aquimarinus]